MAPGCLADTFFGALGGVSEHLESPVYMPSPYNALVRSFLRTLESGEFDAASLEPLVHAEAVLHAPAGDQEVDFAAATGISGYLTKLRDASGGTLTLKPNSFELRDRGAVSLVDASGNRDGDEFTERLRVVLGLADGRVKEVWIDPVDRESFSRAFGE